MIKGFYDRNQSENGSNTERTAKIGWTIGKIATAKHFTIAKEQKGDLLKMNLTKTLIECQFNTQ